MDELFINIRLGHPFIKIDISNSSLGQTEQFVDFFIYLCNRKNDHKMQKRIIILTATLLSLLSVFAQTRNWQVGDGLATGEVQQIIELPNGQILVNCEGVICLTNGHGFSTLSCDMQRTFQLPKFSKGYAYRWQGDSLL